ncbi:Six-hairpin glycosidase-like protein [Pseudomassariella vexata]|uniref:Six-hairpin glycosidase-like protein n=1 Tax=Pseudomassariella vexata TaxID=1141098 RepID=A0A1Y2ELU7_9PEZI|nr:Six-hairpin glycosidase-like protein [Pseudomassariella vexata]ORY71825.1 Six-hairpin glycosidase-like protein [Pseudomassariella vexata]
MWLFTPLKSLVAILFIPLAATFNAAFVDPHKLPVEPVFPGPWDDYIKAPVNKSFITPARIWQIEGNVTTTGYNDLALQNGNSMEDGSILIGEGGLITVEFDENISGRVCFDVESVTDEPVLHLAYSESSLFVGEQTDATNDEKWDLPLDLHVGNRTGFVCVDPEFIRGGFKYLTVYVDVIPVHRKPNASRREYIVAALTSAAQKVLGVGDQMSALDDKWPHSKPSVGIRQIWVNCTSFPSQSNGRAYSGYFYSSSTLLNRIWYAGAYTLQLSTINPKEGSALISANRYLDHNTSPPGSWYSNFTVSQGTAVTTDGAKRDRLVWPGDMYIAIPGIAVSTYDMLAVRNALDVIYERQYADGRLPYAGPPLSYHDEFSDTYHLHALLGTYDYVLYSGDIAWLRQKWPAYIRALRVSTLKVDSKDLMHVTSTYDWNRHGMGGHNIEATAILHLVLKRSIDLFGFLNDDTTPDSSGAIEAPDVALWFNLRQRIENGIKSLYCYETGLYSDNLGERHCFGPDHVDPQDGNSWALIAGMHNRSSQIPLSVSQQLRARWNAFGAPAPEFPNVMSPFASSFELQAHCEAGNHDAAVELMLLMWGYLLSGPGFTNSTLAEGFRVDGHVHYPAYPVPSRNSHAHGWAAGPTSVLMSCILGIEFRKPGGVEYSVRPALTRWLGWARGGFAAEIGYFEIGVKRILLETSGNSTGRRERGTVAIVRGPEGAKGLFGWGDEDEDEGFRQDIVGGEMRAWVRWESSDGDEEEKRTNMRTEELDVKDVNCSKRDDEMCFEEMIPYRDGGMLVYDYTYEEPIMEKRGPGVVDFEALAEGYAKSLQWMR